MKHIYFHCCSLVFLLLFSSQVWAQKAVLRGTVTDNKNEPIPSVSVKATNTATNTTSSVLTDLDGVYEIGNLESGSYSVVFSFVGYQNTTKNISLSKGQNLELSIQLLEDNQVLGEVVVVGYGTQRKREIVGAVTKVDFKEVTPVVGSSFETGLQGQAAGVNITQNSGAAGAGSVVRIRGLSSIGSGGDPLYVIDGILVSPDYFRSGESFGANNNPLSFINPNDIESISVLKDASATAIYGARAANGVIITTTKRGKSGKPKFNFSTTVGLAKPTNIVQFLDTKDWIALRQEAWENDGGVGRVPLPGGFTHEQALATNTDWIGLVLQDGIKSDYNLSMSQGGKFLSSYVGLSYSNGESFLRNNSFQRISGRANLDFKFSENFSIGVSTSLARGLNRRVAEAWAGGLGTAQSTALPFYPIYIPNAAGQDSIFEDGNKRYYNLYGNPVAQAEYQRPRDIEWRTINNLKLTYKFLKGFEFIASGTYDQATYNNSTHEAAIWTGNRDIAKNYRTMSRNINTYTTLSYDWQLNKRNHFKFLIGQEYAQKGDETTGYEYAGLTDFIYLDPDADDDPAGIDTLVYNDTPQLINRWRYHSFPFARVNYDFDQKWYIQATYRRDASSNFGANKRFAYFPAVGVGYLMSEEPFLRDNKVINFLKLKASVGRTGNSEINTNAQWSTYFTQQSGDQNSYNGQPIQYPIQLGNPDIQWELVTTYDGGVEIGLLNDRITADVSFYQKRTTAAIIKTSVSASSGLNTLDFWQNVGVIDNKGIEASLTTHNIVGKFNWKTRINVAHNKNKVVSVGTATPDALDGGFGDTRAVPGYAINTNYLVTFVRVDPATGRPVYLDKDGNETFEYDVANARRAQKDPNPWLTGSINNSFEYKGFSLDAMFYFSLGGLIYDDAAKRQRAILSDWNTRCDIVDHWDQPGDEAMYPRLTANTLNWGLNGNIWQNNHTLWLEDASFVRLRTLTLAYNFKNKSKFFSNLRLAFVGNNLLTFTEYSGWDPEVARGRSNAQERNVGGSNVTYLVGPQEKSYNLRLSFDFN